LSLGIHKIIISLRNKETIWRLR